ncbi:TetR/AcrR family transcriptional regulator [Salimicrobium sp. PL1-032A]|uniref:TetR/AcrR family transcriptional regulator n=1 Tax=Salimicrobium sp. PL1-032A TaxID=3095364 RepID=UPI003260DACF
MSEKRKQVLNVAEQLFYNYGFHGVGLKQIVKEANVATMTLYNHFSSKNKLVEEAIKNREERYWAYICSSSEDYSDETFVRIAQLHGAFLREVSPQGCMFLRAIEVYQDTDEHIANIAKNHKSSVLDYFEELAVRHGIKDHKHFAYEFLLIIEGATSMTQITDPTQATDHAVAMTKVLQSQFLK